MKVPNPWDELHQHHPDALLLRAGISEAGRCYPWHRPPAIVLRAGMLLVEERSVLWHELVHLERRDAPCADGVLEVRQEASCWREAARRALPIRCVEWAVQRARCINEAADLLKVTADLLAIRLQALHPAERAALRQVIERREDAA